METYYKPDHLTKFQETGEEASGSIWYTTQQGHFCLPLSPRQMQDFTKF